MVKASMLERHTGDVDQSVFNVYKPDSMPHAGTNFVLVIGYC